MSFPNHGTSHGTRRAKGHPMASAAKVPAAELHKRREKAATPHGRVPRMASTGTTPRQTFGWRPSAKATRAPDSLMPQTSTRGHDKARRKAPRARTLPNGNRELRPPKAGPRFSALPREQSNPPTHVYRRLRVLVVVVLVVVVVGSWQLPARFSKAVPNALSKASKHFRTGPGMHLFSLPSTPSHLFREAALFLQVASPSV